MIHQRFDGEHDAIGGRAVHLKAPLTTSNGAQGMVERQRVRGRTLLAIGCNDRHVANLFGRAHEAVQAVGKNAVVVRTEESHGEANGSVRHAVELRLSYG